MNNSKRLYRSRTHRVFGGVAGGLADYFNIDVILARLLFVIVFFAGGGGFIIYIILWIITPEEPLITPPPSSSGGGGSESHTNNPDISDAEIVNIEKQDNSNNRPFILGIGLILIGFLFLLNTLIPQLVVIKFWPLVLIIIGVVLLINESKSSKEKENKIETEPQKTESHEI
jgi:phage shock protein PspC (stress-responsive transcriptional regulator)